MFNLQNFEIEDVDFFGDGLYSVYIPDPVPDDCTMPFARGSVVVDNDLEPPISITTQDIISLCETSNGTYKV